MINMMERFYSIFCIYLLVMLNYWGGNYFAHGRFPEVGQKQKTEKERKKERKKERAKVGENNGQATHGARKHAWRTQAAWANFQDWCLKKCLDLRNPIKHPIAM